MTIRIAHSTARDTAAAVQELRNRLGDVQPAFVMFFTTSRHDPEVLGALLRDYLPAPSIGCTTAGEIADGKMLDGALVAIVLDAEHVEQAAVSHVENVHDEAATKQAYDALVSKFDSVDDSEHLLGFVLHDGLGAGEEAVMSTLSSLTNVPFIGGSAGDDLAFEKTLTFVNGQACSGGAALALLRLKKRYQLVKTQSFSVTDTVLTVTEVDEKARRVKQFNGRPAAEEYASALGISVAELPGRFMKNPLAVVLSDGEPFVRSPQKLEGTDVVFYCQVSAGMELKVLESRNIVEDTARDMKAALAAFGPVSGIINFHCILRTLELKERNQTGAYGALFANLPAVGFSTYGESYIGHINQTSTIVLLE